MTLPRIFGIKGLGFTFSGCPVRSSRIGDDDACCAPAATNNTVFAEHFAACAPRVGGIT
jgi:hypothetical protein